MFKFLRERKKNNKGFTLVELVIVVAILAILVGILAPQYTKYVEKSRKAADATNLENLVTAFKTAASDGTDSVAAGTYEFEITSSKTTFKKGTTEITSASTDTNKTIYDLITSYVGDNWTETKLKSSKWVDADGTTAGQSIKAELTVENDGSVTVKYTPSTIKDQANQ